jgi:hypothetical protein
VELDQQAPARVSLAQVGQLEWLWPWLEDCAVQALVPSESVFVDFPCVLVLGARRRGRPQELLRPVVWSVTGVALPDG